MQDLSIAHSQLQLAKGKLEELTRAYTAQQHKLAEAEARARARGLGGGGGRRFRVLGS